MSLGTRLEQVAERKRQILAQIPESQHGAAKQEAWYQQGQRGGIYSDHLAEAVSNILDGNTLGSPLARQL